MTDQVAEAPANQQGQSSAGAGRLEWLDLLRGAAVIGMILFHAGWDMGYFGLLGGPAVPPGWQSFGDGVAAVFLGVSGFSLVLARRRGLSNSHAFRRLGSVFAAALAVTLATWIAVPGSTIFFGILHCIAVGNLLVLPLLRAPFGVNAALATVVLAAPALVPGNWSAASDWVWLGLPGRLPDTLDFRPLLPWAGYILVGIAIAQASSWSGRAQVTGGRPRRYLAFVGRHSLIIYLLHQAVLFPAFYLVAHGAGLSKSNWLDGFESQCRTDCLRVGAGAEICRTACACARSRIATTPLAVDLDGRSATMAERNELGRIAGQCFVQARP